MNWRDAHHSINKWYANLDYISEWVLKMRTTTKLILSRHIKYHYLVRRAHDL